MVCCSQRIWIIFFTLTNILVYATFLYFTCLDLLDTHKPSYWTWVHFIPRFFVYIGLCLYLRVILWIRVLCNPINQKRIDSWAFWMTFPLVSFLLSSIIQGKWVLAGSMLIFLLCNAGVVEYVRRMDELGLNISLDYGSSNNSSRRSHNEENEPLIAGTAINVNNHEGSSCA